jgi:hypothetical protein
MEDLLSRMVLSVEVYPDHRLQERFLDETEV